MKVRFLIPLGIFLLLVGFLLVGLFLDPRNIPSPLIDKPAPAFTLHDLQAPDKTLSLADMRGKVWLLNVWASWCVSCREEHPVLIEMAKQNILPIIGLNYKDKNIDALAWLSDRGDPYTQSIVDPQGAVGLNFGVYGVPETFLIDKNGRIRDKVTGPITHDILKNRLLQKIKELQNGA